jgi:hypothetical protein
MRGAPRTGTASLRLLLASSSVAALLIGGGTPPAFAQQCSMNITGTVSGCTNNVTLTKINVKQRHCQRRHRQ